MVINIYNTLSEAAAVNKNLTLLAKKLTAVPVGEMNPVTPILKLSGENIDSVNLCNYVEIPEYGRFYHCRPLLQSNGIYLLVCTVDPLVSFRRDVLSLECIIDKEEADNNLFINDGTFVHGVKDYTRVYNYSAGFNDSPENILICAGGE